MFKPSPLALVETLERRMLLSAVAPIASSASPAHAAHLAHLAHLAHVRHVHHVKHVRHVAHVRHVRHVKRVQQAKLAAEQANFTGNAILPTPSDFASSPIDSLGFVDLTDGLTLPTLTNAVDSTGSMNSSSMFDGLGMGLASSPFFG